MLGCREYFQWSSSGLCSRYSSVGCLVLLRTLGRIFDGCRWKFVREASYAGYSNTH